MNKIALVLEIRRLLAMFDQTPDRDCYTISGGYFRAANQRLIELQDRLEKLDEALVNYR